MVSSDRDFSGFSESSDICVQTSCITASQVGQNKTTKNINTFLAPDTTYYWRVRGASNSRGGDWSSYSEFKTEKPKEISPDVSYLAQEAANYLSNNNIINKPSDQAGGGTSFVTRAELATMIHRSLGKRMKDATTNLKQSTGRVLESPFVDIRDASTWYYTPVVDLSNLVYNDNVSVFNRGKKNSFNPLFGPGSTISRAWALKALLEAWNIKPAQSWELLFRSSTAFDDVHQNHPAAAYILKARQIGIINGTGSSNKFNPDNEAVRQDIFLMLHRLMDNNANLNNQTIQLPKISPEDFDHQSVKNHIGVRYEQPICDDRKPPSIEVVKKELRKTKIDNGVKTDGVDSSFVYSVELEAMVNGGSKYCIDTIGNYHTKHIFFAWNTDGGTFIDISEPNSIPYKKVKWFSPDKYSPKDSVAKYKITAYVGDNLGSEIKAKTTITIGSENSTTSTVKPLVNFAKNLPAKMYGGRRIVLKGTVRDGGKHKDSDYGIREVRLDYSLNNGEWKQIATNLEVFSNETTNSANNQSVEGNGWWQYNWMVPDAKGTLKLRAVARNLKGNFSRKATHTIFLTPRLVIQGTVLNASGQPVRNAKVQLRGNGFSKTVLTDNDGRFIFDSELPPNVTLYLKTLIDGKISPEKVVTLSENTPKATLSFATMKKNKDDIIIIPRKPQLIVYGFRIRSGLIFADPKSSPEKPNLDAECAIRNTGSHPIVIEDAALSIYDSKDSFLWDMLDEEGQEASYTTKLIEPSGTFYCEYSVSFFKEAGDYKVVPRVKIKGRWYKLASKNFTIKPASDSTTKRSENEACSSDTMPVIMNGLTVNGNICNHKYQRYVFEVSSGYTYMVTAIPTSGDVDLYIHKDETVAPTSNAYSYYSAQDGLDSIIFTANKPGRYFVYAAVYGWAYKNSKYIDSNYRIEVESLNKDAYSYIDKCIKKYSRFFGAKKGNAFSCYQKNYYCQRTTGVLPRLDVSRTGNGKAYYPDKGKWKWFNMSACD